MGDSENCFFFFKKQDKQAGKLMESKKAREQYFNDTVLFCFSSHPGEFHLM